MRRDINFFSQYQGKKKEKKNQDIYIYSLLGFLGVLIIGTLLWNSTSLLLTNKKIKEYQAKLEEPEIQEKITESDEVNSKLSILKNYDKELVTISKSLYSREIVTTNILDKLSSTLPSEVTFNSVNITNTDITIQAESTKRTAIGEIEYNLKQLDNVQDVYIGGISGEEKYTFDIKCVLKDVE
ncbi:PilN domain-containing protein [Clostridium gasigenes]|uniref:PilN domain-containing protein n=1 Tax=Clostridium gasigenes TaxID=94869 RepID=UPI001C0CEB8B|nr:PilN domain-containing protein [Clostridium gasigenes]MBU3137902.1 PilN domain-containing protein [Clostridium gasigenes]